jgi:formate dehydrogenase iron-sulfur subunit
VIEASAATPVVLERLAQGIAGSLGEYRAHGGYEALERAHAMTPDAIVSEIERSGLRGRGGAGFPTGRKWRALCDAEPERSYVVCNADEGDPGAYIDRFILEDDPHCVLEAMAIAAVAVGASHGFVYVRKEYPDGLAAMRRAVREARDDGILGTGPARRDRPTFDVEVVEGQGSYVCGEETALLNALEHRRPEVRARPPYPVERGLWSAPTLVDNVETLASVPWIIRHGADAYAAMGRGSSRGTKVVSLNSLFRRPGLYEVELGVPVREIVDGLGGGLELGPLRGVLIGGPLAGIVPPHLLETPFAFDELRSIGACVGHGGVVAFDDHTSIAELVHHVFRFGAYESCGKCTPCRVGAHRIEEILAAGDDASPADAEQEWHEIVEALAATSLCGHGTGLADLARSVGTNFAEELRSCFG